MKHPAYHLRPNKAVDRMALVEAVIRLARLGDLAEYTYYGLGGPYLEDFRLLYELCPGMKMVSIEEDADTLRRQRFHRPCGSARLSLERTTLADFLEEHDLSDRKSVLWLDYTRLEYACFGEFVRVLESVPPGSMVKVTLRAEPKDYLDRPGEEPGTRADAFRAEFGEMLPDPTTDPPGDPDSFAALLQHMLRIAAQRALPSETQRAFQIVSSFHYADGVGMLTLTGVVCERDARNDVRRAFETWNLSNLGWRKPRRIDVPVLSTRERLHLQRHLPSRRRPGRALRRALGYLIDEDWRTTESKLTQYAEFHRYLPYFMRATP